MYRWLTVLFIVLVAALTQDSSLAESPEAPEIYPVSRKKTLQYSRKIDAIIESHLAKTGQSRNPKIDDEIFLRRIYLDAIGRIPNIDEAEEFLGSDASQKRAVLIDELLASYGYVSRQFNFFADLLRVKTRLANNVPGVPYIDFIKDSLEQNKPYDQLVFEMLSAEGALMEKHNGSVGYYLRDLNMPEDNMSNTVRVFLGTRLECAQCHDHPFDKWTQRQYFEMVAFTGGMNFRVNNGGGNYGRQIRDFRKKVAQGKKKVDSNAAAAVRRTYQAISSGISGTGTGLARLPESYEGSRGASDGIVTAKTMFDGESIIDVEIPVANGKKKKRKKKRKAGRNIRGAQQIGSREAYAEWLTNVDNPRFAKVIANRLWKQAFGIGVIEPVDVIEDGTVASNPELMDYLTEVMIEVEFDMKQFLRIIYNTKTWQAEVTRNDVTNIRNYGFPGPIMRRMSAEQLWDSMVGLTVDDIDQRRNGSIRLAAFGRVDAYEYYDKIKDKSLEEIYAMVSKKFRSKGMMMDQNESPGAAKEKLKNAAKEEARAKRKEASRKLQQINKQIARARRAGEREKVRQLLIKRSESVSAARSKQEKFSRASELQSPAPAKHLLREFGQSDRETIENANTDPAVTQVLRLMNGFVDNTIGKDANSVLTRNVLFADNEKEAIEAVYLTMLSRKPTKSEIRIWLKDFRNDSKSTYTDLVWTLINSNEFIFVR